MIIEEQIDRELNRRNIAFDSSIALVNSIFYFKDGLLVAEVELYRDKFGQPTAEIIEACTQLTSGDEK